jgi:hypothetical protein
MEYTCTGTQKAIYTSMVSHDKLMVYMMAGNLYSIFSGYNLLILQLQDCVENPKIHKLLTVFLKP